MFDAIILAGGSARRLGGADKPAVQIGASSMLEHALAAVGDADQVIVVGPRRSVSRAVLFCQEQPPGGGPVAALATGAIAVRAPVVLILAADMPAIGPAVALLVAAVGTADCAVLTDADGRRNFLAAAWRTAALRDALAGLPVLAGAPARSLYRAARINEVADLGGWSRDCDTWADVVAARHGEGSEIRP